MKTLRVTAAALVLAAMPAVVAGQTATAGIVRSEKRTIDVPSAGKVEVTTGFLSVPENRNERSSRLIEIAFLRMHSRVANATPLFYLAGGPGDAAVTDEPRALASYAPLLASGDVILIDQRGTGKSLPNLSWRWPGVPPLNLFTHIDTNAAFIRKMNQAAVAHFKSRGVDLRGYNTEQSADDIDALRRALGYDRINIMGFSYGTHLGLSIIRRHGTHVQNAVLIGTEGPAHTLKLPSTQDVQWRKLALMVAADAELSKQIPDLIALRDRVLQKLDGSPAVVKITDPRSGTQHDVPIAAHGLRVILRRDIGDASDLPVFPRLLYSIDKGDLSLLTWFVGRRYTAGTHLMSYAMDAASGVSPERQALIDAEAAKSPFSASVNFPSGDVGIDMPDLGEVFRAPVASSVRTLFLSGTLDFNTPPFQAEEIRWGFPNSSHIIVRNAGHEQVMTHPAVRAAIVQFLAGKDVDGTKAEWPALRFVPLVGYDAERTHPSVSR